MRNHSLTKEDLISNLKEQLYFLDSSISSFSKHQLIHSYENKLIGEPINVNIKSEIEAKRIATIIRVLLHDTFSSLSLFNLLVIKDKIKYWDTCLPNDGRLHSMTNLSGIRGSISAPYWGLVAKINAGNSLIAVPLFEQHLREWYSSYILMDFENWWNKEVAQLNGFNYKRSDLILKAANKDGGAHIDKNLPIEYYAAKQSKLIMNVEGIETEFERNLVFASIAQIGWELLNSITPEIF